MQEFFGGKQLDVTINPDEAVAYGAAVHAAVLKGDPSGKLFGKLVYDVVPISLGYDLRNDDDIEYTKIIIPRNSVVPVSKTHQSVTAVDNQKECSFTIFQGESLEQSSNIELGEFFIRGLPPGPAESIKFNTIFNVDVNGILTVTATETSTGKSNSIQIENVADQSHIQRLKKMVDNAQKHCTEIRMRRMTVAAREALEKERRDAKGAPDGDDAADAKYMLRDAMVEQCNEVLQSIQSHADESHDDYEQRVANFIKPLLEKIKEFFSENKNNQQ